jgi:hypothetical protein
VTGPKDQIRQSVKAFEERRLSTSSRAKDGKYLVGLDKKVDIPEGLNGIVVEIEIFDDDFTSLRHKTPLGPMPDIPVNQPLSHHVYHQDEQDQSGSSPVSHFH